MPLFPLIVIIVSASAIALILCLKVIELRTGAPGFFSHLSLHCDGVIQRKTKEVKMFISARSFGSVLRALHLFLVKALSFAGLVGGLVLRKCRKVAARIRGERSVKGGGVVSFFLKNMSESKGEDKEGMN